MTLEQIKAEIKWRIIRIANLQHGNRDEFYYGEHYAFEQCLDLLKDLDPTWHPYPQEKPTEGGAYLITRYTKEGGIFVDIDAWIPQYEMFDSTEDIPSSMKVLAWMELPKPYREEVIR